MNYQLNSSHQYRTNNSVGSILKKLRPMLSGEYQHLAIALTMLLINTGLNLAAPYIVGRTIDTYIKNRQYQGIIMNGLILLAIYVGILFSMYFQTKKMGTVGQHLLFNLRNNIFTKLQSLPVAFFNQNKAGDLISRINNDTDNLNQFISQALIQFVGAIFMMAGTAVFIISLNWKLGLAALGPAAGIIIFTQVISKTVREKNTTSLQAVGRMSAEIQESLDNFKVVVAFNRQDYFRDKFADVNKNNFKNAIAAGILNNVFTPTYTMAANVAQVIVLIFGISLIARHEFTVGLLVSYLVYLGRFYDPVRQVAGLWASFQAALGSWDRVAEVLALKSDLVTVEDKKQLKANDFILSFDNVSFHYPEGKDVLKRVKMELRPGKPYALVGPTGGGKTTTASLMSRLYDASSGKVRLEGEDIKSYSSNDLSDKIGFILQEPFLFSGTVKDNILYGSEKYKDFNNQQTMELLKEYHLEDLLSRFDQGLETMVAQNGNTISLGQRQLIAFMRAVIRQPKLLILDEATANIDTVTEKMLDDILDKLPESTTKVIIAHRLNTIANADEIYFVNSGEVVPAGSLDHALKMLLSEKRTS